MHIRNGARRHLPRLRALALLSVFVVAATPRSEAQTRAYVAHPGANVVTAIDTASGTAVATISVGAGPVNIATTRDGSRAYVANRDSDSISVIDAASDAVVAEIAVGDSPTYLAVAPDDSRLYVMTASGVVDVVDTASQAIAANINVGASGEIAITPDGTRVYVAAGQVFIIDTASNAVIKSFAAETAVAAGVSNSATSLAIAPDGTRAYVGVFTINTSNGNFGAGGSIILVDTATEAVSGEINLFSSVPGSIALTPDGSRLYLGVQATFVNTGYGMGFLPGGHAYVIDTITNRIGAFIDYGQLNTPAGIGVAADRSAVFAAIPRLNSVAVSDVNTNAVTSLISVTAGPGHLAVVPNNNAALVPYAIDAVDDGSTMTTAGGTAVANVLANDRLGGFPATTAHVTLTQASASGFLTLDPATGAVNLAAGGPVGTETLVYRICEIASASNCDEATVTVEVLAPYVIDAVNDSGVTLPNRTVLASVLANDTLGGTAAAGRVTLSVVSSTSAGLVLNLANGSLFVAEGTAPGTQTLTYRICEIVNPANYDDADATITVNAFPIDAVNDSGLVARAGGTAVANVLANDRFAAATATLAKVSLSQVSSTNAGVSLNSANGAVTVAAGTPDGAHTLQYRICEIATPSNCDEAIVTLTVLPVQIRAVNDIANGSSKLANTALASVLANDWLGSVRATTSNVRLSFVSLSPANTMIRLDLTDGSVDVLGKTDSGTYLLVYEICERAVLTNCARATVTVNLSGR